MTTWFVGDRSEIRSRSTLNLFLSTVESKDMHGNSMRDV